MSAPSLVARLNVFSHTLGFDTPNARLVCEAADALTGRIAQVYARNVYGNTLIYPANATADLFCDLVKKDTLSPKDLAIMRTLGYTVTQVPDPRMVVV